MDVPSFVWPEVPWSPVGYQVVVTDETAPGSEDGPQAEHPSCWREITQPERRPWALAGYRVVEVVEESSPGPRRRRSDDAGAPKDSPVRKARLAARWIAVAGFGTFMLAAAAALVAPRLSAWTRGTGSQVAAGENGLPGEPQRAARDCPNAARETFGTAVGFVRSPADAARIAAKEQKLTFLLHVSGDFDDPGFT